MTGYRPDDWPEHVAKGGVALHTAWTESTTHGGELHRELAAAVLAVVGPLICSITLTSR